MCQIVRTQIRADIFLPGLVPNWQRSSKDYASYGSTHGLPPGLPSLDPDFMRQNDHYKCFHRQIEKLHHFLKKTY